MGKPSRRTILKRALAGSAAAIGIDALLIEPQWLELTRTEIRIAGLAPEFDGYRIALLADLHYPFWAGRGLSQQAVRLANAFRPDLVAFAGDIVAQPRGRHTVPSLHGLFDGLSAPDGAYAVRGNHDHWVDGARVAQEVRADTPFQLLEQKHVLIERGSSQLAIAGVGDLWTSEMNVDKALEGVPPNVPRIVLCHNPDVAEIDAGNSRADLLLSGHTHGGQVRLPGGPAPRIPSAYGSKFAQGVVQGARRLVYVSRGLCSVGFVRFACRPEVSGIVLRRAGDEV